jgi:hypothetical protein
MLADPSPAAYPVTPQQDTDTLSVISQEYNLAHGNQRYKIIPIILGNDQTNLDEALDYRDAIYDGLTKELQTASKEDLARPEYKQAGEILASVPRDPFRGKGSDMGVDEAIKDMQSDCSLILKASQLIRPFVKHPYKSDD